MCKCQYKHCVECGGVKSRIKLCESGRNGVIHLKPTANNASPLLRVTTNVVDTKKEIDLAVLMEEENIEYICDDCMPTPE